MTILHLTQRSQLEAVDCNRTVSFPASLLDERMPFQDMKQIGKHLRILRRQGPTDRFER